MSPVDGWSVVPNLLQAFICFYQVFFQRKPILEVSLKPFKDVAERPFQGLYIILRNPLEKDIYLENLTLCLQRRRLAYRNPPVYTVSLANPDAASCLAPESLTYAEILAGREPLVPGRAMYLSFVLPPLVPVSIIEQEPALVITVVADLQSRPSLTARLDEAVNLAQWEGFRQHPQQIGIVDIDIW